MSGHTKGPWTVGRVSFADNGDVMYHLHGVKEANANDARLIGAAPDLLSALIAYRDAKPQCECSSGSGCKMAAARDLAIAAIAKATHEPREVK